jgi:hypothetical protein
VSEEPRRSSRIDRDGFIAPSQISHAVSFGMFLVHPCRNVAGCARTVGAAIRSKDKGDRPLQHKRPRVKLVRVRSTMHVWSDLDLSRCFRVYDRPIPKNGDTLTLPIDGPTPISSTYSDEQLPVNGRSAQML